MKTRTRFAAVGIALVATCACADQQADKDAETLQGTWVVASAVGSGPPPFFPKGRQYEFTRSDGGLVFREAGDSDKKVVAECKIDSTKEPMHIDFVFKERGKELGIDFTLRGVYVIEGERLTVCIGAIVGRPDGKVMPSERPTALAKGFQKELFVFERASK